MAEKLVLAVDGGPASDAAADWVADRAERAPLDVRIVAVLELGWALFGIAEDIYRDSYDRAVYLARRRLDGAPNVRITSSVLSGEPLHQLVAASEGADLVVIGSNKTSPVVGFVYGTLPLRLAAHVRAPLVVVPAVWRPAQGNVVAGVDGTPTSKAALYFAAADAREQGTGLTVVHAWSLPTTVALDPFATVPLDKVLEGHDAILQEATDSVRDAFPDLAVEGLLEKDHPANALVRAAGSATLVVVGSHGRGPIGGLILGSVGHDLLLNMPCPVAIVPPADRTTPLPWTLDE